MRLKFFLVIFLLFVGNLFAQVTRNDTTFMVWHWADGFSYRWDSVISPDNSSESVFFNIRRDGVLVSTSTDTFFTINPLDTTVYNYTVQSQSFSGTFGTEIQLPIVSILAEYDSVLFTKDSLEVEYPQRLQINFSSGSPDFLFPKDITLIFFEWESDNLIVSTPGIDSMNIGAPLIVLVDDPDSLNSIIVPFVKDGEQNTGFWDTTVNMRSGSNADIIYVINPDSSLEGFRVTWDDITIVDGYSIFAYIISEFDEYRLKFVVDTLVDSISFKVVIPEVLRTEYAYTESITDSIGTITSLGHVGFIPLNGQVYQLYGYQFDFDNNYLQNQYEKNRELIRGFHLKEYNNNTNNNTNNTQQLLGDAWKHLQD